MNAGQFSKADAQKDYDEELDSGGRTQKSNRRWLLYGIGFITILAILVICVISIFTCKLPILSSLLPICKPSMVITPPTITKTFSPDSIALNEVSTLTFTLGNSNSVASTGVTFIDDLPSGLQVADVPSATTDCSGEPTWAPLAGATMLNFGSPTGGTIPANGSCSVSVNITGTALGQHENVSGPISSANGGMNTSSTGRATVSITVVFVLTPGPTGVTPPDMTESFVPDQILSNNASTLTFAITNPNTNETLTGVTFSNTYPDGLTNATPLDTTNTCGGTLTADAGGNGVSLSDGTVPAASNCTVTVNVTASNDGLYENTSVVVLSTNGGTGTVASDALYVGDVIPPVSSINFLKEVSTSAEGPWSKFISVNPGTNIYYRFIIENKGIAPFYQFSVADPAVSTASCLWPATLPVEISGHNDHIAICVVGPIAAESGTHANTAAASGSYTDKPYTTASSTATYVATSQTSLDFYLPDTQQKFGSQIQDQLDVFNKTNTGASINIKYYSEPESIKSDSAIGLFVLTSQDVVNFAEQGRLLPVSPIPENQDYLEDARERVTVNGQLFAYPWQREICSSNYLNLAVSTQLPSDAAVVASKLGIFLTNEDNQRTNFKTWQIYPTLDRFYHPVGESKFPEVSCSAVDQQATGLAEELVNVLSEKFGVSVQPSLAKGLDAVTIGGTPGELAGTITPVIDGNQKYKEREVKGTFSVNSSSVNNDLFDLDTWTLINKGAFESSLLPIGSYILACTTIVGDRNCLAVSIEQGIEFQIDPNIIFDEDNLVLANVPYARYEQGSTKKCFYVVRRQVCIRAFR